MRISVAIAYATCIIQIAAGVLSLVACILLFVFGVYPQELSVLHFQLACGCVGFLSILLGLETLTKPDDDKRIVRNASIFGLSISLILCLSILLTCLKFGDVYLGDTIMGSELSIWDEDVLSIYNAIYVLGIISAVCLILTMPLLGFSIYKSLK